jgi:hypothetical protein
MATLKRFALAGLLMALTVTLPRGAGGGAFLDLAVVVNLAVPITRLSASDLEGIYTSTRHSWPDGSNVSVFSYPPESEIRHAFDGAVLRMSPEDVARFWLDQRVRGGSRPPRQVPDPVLAVRLAAKLPGSIVYIPEDLVNATVKVVARIKAGKVVAP